MMDRKNAILIYLLGSFCQMIVACLLVFLFKYKIPFIGLFAIIIGGVSTALWGTFVSCKYKGISIKKVLFDFVNIKVSYRYYMLVLMYLLIDFCYLLFGGTINVDEWYMPLILLLKAIIFGGIEEIGWRYTFQPIMEEKISFTFSTLITFIFWGIWHFLYFYIDGSIAYVQVIPFLMGLLTNCFILGTLYKVTNSLFICVITHALINMLAQSVSGGNEVVKVLSCIIIIIVSIIVSMKKNKNL